MPQYCSVIKFVLFLVVTIINLVILLAHYFADFWPAYSNAVVTALRFLIHTSAFVQLTKKLPVEGYPITSEVTLYNDFVKAKTN